MAGKGKILVVGGGISGLTAAVEAAEVGYEVYLVEKNSFLGGRVVRLNQYFPKLCPPTCGLEINFRRVRTNPNITTLTEAEVDRIEGKPGAYTVTLKLHPRYINDKCTACNKCVEACPVERENDFNYGLDTTKAIYRPHMMAFPMRYALDMSVCKGTSCNKCVEACSYDAIDLEAKQESMEIEVGAIVVATGWQPYDPTNLENLGGGQEPDVITNVVMERLASKNGPTGGKITRPSDDKEIKSVAFVQCAGSRDENHLAFCSGVCCLATLKHASYVHEQYPDAKIFMFYIDVRASGRNEDFYTKIVKETGLTLRKGKVAKITREGDGRLTVEAEDVDHGVKSAETVDLVVLATGMQPSLADNPLPGKLNSDDYGFLAATADSGGIFSAGCAKSPVDVSTSVQDATAAALKAIQIAGRTA
jgi:quinone-modifying oxidoreductase subunit QmoA